MLPIFYIGKRSFFDITRTGVFWVILGLTMIVSFGLLYTGWKKSHEGPFAESGQYHQEEFGAEESFETIAMINPRAVLLYFTYGSLIGFANLLAVFVMMGLLSRDIDLRRIDMLIARPVSRTQIYIGKLLAGWASIILYLVLATLWCGLVSIVSGMGYQEDLTNAVLKGIIAPCLVGTVVYMISLYTRSVVAGVIGMVILGSSNNPGMVMIKMIGLTLLKVKTAIWMLYKMLPPMNVIGQNATNEILSGLWKMFVSTMYEDLYPIRDDGIYTEMWQVYAYLAVILVIGWISFAKREFN